MKKVLLSFAVMLMAGASFAQVKFGITAGPSFSSTTYKNPLVNNGNKKTSDMLTGLRAGVTVDLPLADEFFIQPSLLYVGKGGKQENALGADVKTRLHYLELPLNFMYKPEVGTGNLFIGLGPYFSYALGGKVGDNDIDFGSDNALQTKRMDAGANFQVGYELPMGLNFGLHTDLGLVNINGAGNDDNRVKNTSFGVSVGYKFGSMMRR